MMRLHTSAKAGLAAVPQGNPKAKRQLRLDAKEEEEVETEDPFGFLNSDNAGVSDQSSDDEESYEMDRQIEHKRKLVDRSRALVTEVADIRSK